MKHRIFNWLVATIVALSLPVASLAHDDDTDDSPKSTKEESIRERVKTEREVSKKALEDFRAKKKDSTERQKALIAYGDKAADHRLKALEEMEKRLSSGKCSAIGESTKASITGQINSMKATINSQKGLIDKSANADEAKKNIKNVFEKNRVFIHFIPALNGICASQRVIDLVDGKIATAIAKLKSAGKDTAAIEAKASAAKAAAQSAQTLYKQVADNPGANSAHTTIDAAKAKLKEAKTALEQVKELLEQERDRS